MSGYEAAPNSACASEQQERGPSGASETSADHGEGEENPTELPNMKELKSRTSKHRQQRKGKQQLKEVLEERVKMGQSVEVLMQQLQETQAEGQDLYKQVIFLKEREKQKALEIHKWQTASEQFQKESMGLKRQLATITAARAGEAAGPSQAEKEAMSMAVEQLQMRLADYESLIAEFSDQANRTITEDPEEADLLEPTDLSQSFLEVEAVEESTADVAEGRVMTAAETQTASGGNDADAPLHPATGSADEALNAELLANAASAQEAAALAATRCVEANERAAEAEAAARRAEADARQVVDDMMARCAEAEAKAGNSAKRCAEAEDHVAAHALQCQEAEAAKDIAHEAANEAVRRQHQAEESAVGFQEQRAKSERQRQETSRQVEMMNALFQGVHRDLKKQIGRSRAARHEARRAQSEVVLTRAMGKGGGARPFLAKVSETKSCESYDIGDDDASKEVEVDAANRLEVATEELDNLKDLHLQAEQRAQEALSARETAIASLELLRVEREEARIELETCRAEAAREAAAAQASLESAEAAARQSSESALAEAINAAEAAKEELSSLRAEFVACRDARAALEDRAEANRREAEEHLSALRKLEAEAEPQDLQRFEGSMAEMQRLTTEADKASARESQLQAELEKNQAFLAQTRAALKEAREKEKDSEVSIIESSSSILSAEGFEIVLQQRSELEGRMRNLQEHLGETEETLDELAAAHEDVLELSNQLKIDNAKLQEQCNTSQRDLALAKLELKEAVEATHEGVAQLREQQVAEVSRLELALQETITAAQQNACDREATQERIRALEAERERLCEYRQSDRALCEELEGGLTKAATSIESRDMELCRLRQDLADAAESRKQLEQLAASAGVAAEEKQLLLEEKAEGVAKAAEEQWLLLQEREVQTLTQQEKVEQDKHDADGLVNEMKTQNAHMSSCIAMHEEEKRVMKERQEGLDERLAKALDNQAASSLALDEANSQLLELAEAKTAASDGQAATEQRLVELAQAVTKAADGRAAAERRLAEVTEAEAEGRRGFEAAEQRLRELEPLVASLDVSAIDDEKLLQEQTRFSNLETRLVEATANLQSRDSDLQELQQKLTDAEEAASEQRQLLEQRESQMLQHQAELQEKLDSAANEMATQSALLQSRLDAHESEKQEMLKFQQELDEQRNTALADHSSTATALEQASASLASRDVELQRLQDSLAEAAAQLQQGMSTAAVAAAEQQQRQVEEREALEEQLSKALANQTSLEKREACALEQQRILAEKADLAMQDSGTIATELNAQNVALSNQITQHEEQRRVMEASEQQLQLQLNESLARQAGAADDLDEANARVAQLATAEDAALQSRALIEQQLGELQQTVIVSQQAAADASNGRAAAETRLSEAEADASRKQVEAEQIAQRLQEAEASVPDAARLQEQMQQQLQQQQQQMQEQANQYMLQVQEGAQTAVAQRDQQIVELGQQLEAGGRETAALGQRTQELQQALEAADASLQTLRAELTRSTADSEQVGSELEAASNIVSEMRIEKDNLMKGMNAHEEEKTAMKLAQQALEERLSTTLANQKDLEERETLALKQQRLLQEQAELSSNLSGSLANDMQVQNAALLSQVAQHEAQITQHAEDKRVMEESRQQFQIQTTEALSTQANQYMLQVQESAQTAVAQRDQQIVELGQRLEAGGRDAATLGQRTQELQQALEAADAQLLPLRAELAMAQQATASMEGRDAELDILRQSVADAQETRRLLEEREALAREQQVASEEKADRLARELNQAQTAGSGAEALQQQLSQLQGELDQARTAGAGAEVLQQQVLQLQSELHQARTAGVGAEALQQQVLQLQGELDLARTTGTGAEALQQQVLQLQGDLSQARTAWVAADDQLVQLQEDLDQARMAEQQLLELRGELNQARIAGTLAETLQQQVLQLQGELSQVQTGGAGAEALQQQVSQLQSELSQAQTAGAGAQVLQQQLLQLQGELDQARAVGAGTESLQQQLLQLQRELVQALAAGAGSEALQQQLQVAQVSLQTSAGQAEALQHALRNTAEKAGTQEVQLQQTIAAMEVLRAERDALQLGASSQPNPPAEPSAAATPAANTALEAQLATANLQLFQAQAERQSLESTFRSQMEEAQRSLSSLNMERETLRRQLAEAPTGTAAQAIPSQAVMGSPSNSDSGQLQEQCRQLQLRVSAVEEEKTVMLGSMREHVMQLARENYDLKTRAPNEDKAEKDQPQQEGGGGILNFFLSPFLTDSDKRDIHAESYTEDALGPQTESSS